MRSGIVDANGAQSRPQETPALGSDIHAAGLSAAFRALMHAADVSDIANDAAQLVSRLDSIELVSPSTFRAAWVGFRPRYLDGLNLDGLNLDAFRADALHPSGAAAPSTMAGPGAIATRATPEILDVFGFRSTAWTHGESLGINRVGGTQNCSRCATALDSTWNGEPRRAKMLFNAYDLREARNYLLKRPAVVRRISQSLGYDSLAEDPAKIAQTSRERVIRVAATHFLELTDDEAIAGRLGFDISDFEYVRYRNLRSLLRTWPSGSKGVLTIDRSGVGHAMNVIRHRGQTFIIDAQSNLQVQSFSADNIGVLRTRDIPKSVDLDAMGLTSPFDPY